jgi:hypothetical protein
VQNNDRIILFFAGHGRTVQTAEGRPMGYMIPVDADMGNVQSTAISMDQIRGLSRRLQAKHVLYLIGAGIAGPELGKSGILSPREPDYLQIITTRKAHQILTAGGKGNMGYTVSSTIGEVGPNQLMTRFYYDRATGEIRYFGQQDIPEAIMASCAVGEFIIELDPQLGARQQIVGKRYSREDLMQMSEQARTNIRESVERYNERQ